jgi:predicted Rossmann fold nucleotide-binding protein DprA/Smf involved in DNA uptake
MNTTLSQNTQAVLLLTAPLLVGRNGPRDEILTEWEYKKLARSLAEMNHQPADLLDSNGSSLVRECEKLIQDDRLQRLLSRGFLLSQAVERWQSRAIWVVSHADAGYPSLLKSRLRESAPPLLYGCGDTTILGMEGFAVVGSRHVDDTLLEYAERAGQLIAESGYVLISGGARGIDQAAMRGALEADGKTVGIMADSLERAALSREHRDLLMSQKLLLISPYDPSAGFNVGHAMQRNKLIYALSRAALVVNADYETGGTWTGAVEQLEKLKFVPIYVRSDGHLGKGIEALRRKGAIPWPNPRTTEEFLELMSNAAGEQGITGNKQLPLDVFNISNGS